VQAQEHDNLEALLDAAAAQVSEEVDVDSLLRLSAPLPKATTPSPVPPNRRHIAIASDRAFAFCYPHLIREWVQAGMTLSLFSPLAKLPRTACRHFGKSKQFYRWVKERFAKH